MTPLQAEYRRRAAARHDVAGQMAALYAWARHPGARIIELGTGNLARPDGYSGNSTAAFLAGTERSGGQLWSVDIADPPVPPEWRELEHWHLLAADDTSGEAVAFCPDQADVLFIDTSHAYDHTLEELRLYGPKIRPGGVILLHDTDRLEWPGVALAADVWCRASHLDWYDHPPWPGLGVIEIPA